MWCEARINIVENKWIEQIYEIEEIKQEEIEKIKDFLGLLKEKVRKKDIKAVDWFLISKTD